MIYFLQLTPEQYAFLGYVVLGVVICFFLMGLGMRGHWVCERHTRRRLARSAAAHQRVLEGRVDPTLAYSATHFEDTVRMPERERDADDTQPPYFESRTS